MKKISFVFFTIYWFWILNKYRETLVISSQSILLSSWDPEKWRKICRLLALPCKWIRGGAWDWRVECANSRLRKLRRTLDWLLLTDHLNHLTFWTSPILWNLKHSTLNHKLIPGIVYFSSLFCVHFIRGKLRLSSLYLQLGSQNKWWSINQHIFSYVIL